eukprot:m.134966 g.134966  ORF g.134966 m.134966 type:complete len:117 (+) comp14707_c0_seq5:3917-4267(+)
MRNKSSRSYTPIRKWPSLRKLPTAKTFTKMKSGTEMMQLRGPRKKAELHSFCRIGSMIFRPTAMEATYTTSGLTLVRAPSEGRMQFSVFCTVSLNLNSCEYKIVYKSSMALKFNRS